MRPLPEWPLFNDKEFGNIYDLPNLEFEGIYYLKL